MTGKTKVCVTNALHFIRRRTAPIMRRRYWKRHYLQIKAINSFVFELGKLGIVAVIIVIICLVLWELRREVTLIEPIEMPKRLADAGYTPHVVANQLMGNLLFIYESVKTISPNLAIVTTRPDIIVPGTGFTIRKITGYLQSILHDPTTRITGEVTEKDGNLQFNLRINGRHIEIPEPSHKELSACLTHAIHAVLRETNNHVLATYLFFNEDNRNLEAARKEVVRVIATAPEKSEQKAQAYSLYGMILNEQKDFDEAIDMLNKALSINRREPSFFLNLANALYQKGKGDEAIKNLRKAIELDPRYAPAYPNLATYIYALHHDGKEATKYLRKAIELNPKDVTAYHHLGIILNILGNRDEAIENLRQAIELDPGYAIAYYHLGSIYKDMSKYDKAIKKFDKAIELDPKYTLAYNNLGKTLIDSGRHDEAIKHLHKAIELDPKYAPAYNNLGAVFAKSGKYDEAIKNFRQAIELDPGYAFAYKNLCKAYLIGGNFNHSEAMCRQALTLFQNTGVTREVKEVQKLLQKIQSQGSP